MSIFSGSYTKDDVEFLLKPIEMAFISIEKKERLIQSGQAHYSELLSQEPAPTPKHLAIFEQATQEGIDRLAKEVLMLAKALSNQFTNQNIVLVSLVRAGVPLGVLLHRALKDMGHKSFHYAVSIIRDRGIDEKALHFIEQKHGTKTIVFVDGWTGKGAIANQLSSSLQPRKGYQAQPQLVALADPCGKAWMSASFDDWLIPFGILGAPISGLVSRSLWSIDDYHACVLCKHLNDYDLSLIFANKVHAVQQAMQLNSITPFLSNQMQKKQLQHQSSMVLTQIKTRFNIDELNRIKPGIAEATRAVLRRVPEHILVKDSQDKDLSLLLMLAEEKGIQVQEMGCALGQYKAITIIKKVL